MKTTQTPPPKTTPPPAPREAKSCSSVAIYPAHTAAEAARVLLGPRLWAIARRRTAGRLDRRCFGGSVLGGSLSAIVAALVSIGIPRNSILQYEAALKAGKFVLIAHGTSEDTAKAKGILNRTKPETLEITSKPKQTNKHTCQLQQISQIQRSRTTFSRNSSMSRA